MADNLTQDAVLYFLQSKGGTVKNSELLLHFKSYLRDNENKALNREAFKKFVNSVATVKQEDGVAYVVLRKKFKGHISGDVVSGGISSKQPRRKPDPVKQRDPKPEEPSRHGLTEVAPRQLKHSHRDLVTDVPTGESPKSTGNVVLPSAGIVANNNHDRQAETNLRSGKLLQGPPPPASERTRHQPYSITTQQSQTINYTTPLQPADTGNNQNVIRASLIEYNTTQPSTRAEATPEHPRGASDHRSGNCFPPAHIQTRAAPLIPAETTQRETGTAGGSQLDHQQHQVTRRRAKHRQSYKTAVSYDDCEVDEEEEIPTKPGPAKGALPLNAPVERACKATPTPPYTSNPLAPLSHISPPPPLTIPEVEDRSPSLPRLPEVPIICIQDSTGDIKIAHGPRQSLGMGLEPNTGMHLVPEDSEPLRRSLPLEAEYSAPSPDRGEDIGTYHQTPPLDQPFLLGSPRPRPEPLVLPGLGSEFEPAFGSGQRLHLGPGAGPSPSQGSLHTPSSADCFSSDGPHYASPHDSRGYSSDEGLFASTGDLPGEAKVQEMLQRAKETKLLALMHRAERKSTTPWHHSTGHLEDTSTGDVSWHRSTDHLHGDREEEVADSSDDSTPVLLRQRPNVARRVSSRLRNRLCRSLGADLDQPFLEDRQARERASARQDRLHLLSSLTLRHALSSSSLSSCSTPPRTQSLEDLAEEGKKVGRRGGASLSPSPSAPPHAYKFHQQANSVPLEAREHAWVVKGAAGSWTDIYALFREDPTLLNKRDFISGYTVLHWIAKHGDHRVLNTLWYGVNKTGLKLEVDAKSTCGYTPLHLAAIHGHKKMMRLLVQKFKANVMLRDTAGKKPWQYVGKNGPVDTLQLLGAPRGVIGKGAEAGVHHGLHHSSSSVERRHRARPITVSGPTKVKRSSSIAAFLKHKSMLRFAGLHSDSSAQE